MAFQNNVLVVTINISLEYVFVYCVQYHALIFIIVFFACYLDTTLFGN